MLATLVEAGAGVAAASGAEEGSTATDGSCVSVVSASCAAASSATCVFQVKADTMEKNAMVDIPVAIMRADFAG